MVVLSLLILITILILSLKRNTYGLAGFIAIRILVPETVRFLGTSISLNTSIIITIYFTYLFKLLANTKKIKLTKFERRYCIVLLGFVIYSLVALILSNFADLTFQSSNLLQFFITDILPAVYALLVIRNKKDIDIICKALYMSTFITCIYGIFTSIIGTNPYVLALAGGIDLRNGEWKGVSTCSTFSTATGFGYFLTMMFPLLLFLNSRNRNRKSVTVLILTIICIILCKKRTALLSAIIVIFILAILELKKRKANKVIAGLMCVLIAIPIIYVIPLFSTLRLYINSVLFFFNDNASGVAVTELGSTWALRLRQITYPFIEIKGNYIFGNGVSWCQWYLSEYLLHPIMFGFETIFATAICEYGLMGFALYFVLFRESYTFARNNSDKKMYNFELLYLIGTLVMCVGSGFNYQYFFFLGIILMHKFNKLIFIEKEELYELISNNCNASI